MDQTYLNILISIGCTIFGLVLSQVVEAVRNHHRFKQELKNNNNIDISGTDWYAAWQTCVDLTVNLNTEHIKMVQKGQTVRINNTEKSPENPKGGYFWTGQLRFYHGKSLMGWYFPTKEENITSKGIMFLSYQSTKKIFFGKWVGSSYDGDLSNGFVVISKSRDNSLELLKSLLKTHNDKVNIIWDAV